MGAFFIIVLGFFIAFPLIGFEIGAVVFYACSYDAAGW